KLRASSGDVQNAGSITLPGGASRQPVSRASNQNKPATFREHSKIARLVGSIAILGALLLLIDFRGVGIALYRIGAPSLTACIALLVLAQFLSSVRFHYLLRDHGTRVPFRDVARANIYGLVGGMLIFNVFGQGVTRAVLLSRYGVPQSTIFFLTLV